MKKFFSTLLLAWCFTASVAFAYGYPRFWKGDTNYPLVDGRQSIAWYLDKNSIKIKFNDPPYYIITAQTIVINDSDYSPGNEKYSNDKEISSTMDYEFFYDEEELDMRIGDLTISNWRYLRAHEASTAESYHPMSVGEAVFYIATGRKFYGNYLWKTGDKYFDEFEDVFYKDLR
ncbi:MAG: hypothetical protein SR3Q1_11535 [Quinella sp. 3Q1]|nr:hypothetical protein [Quinella sp. 3Q1]MBR3051862.1 hypothetical protein [Selenomonadaceae bacterium]MBR6888383.1 hypothetical protein [Selenomonadaceae bacterium]